MRSVRMRTELAAAHEAQMAIMPQAPPDLPGFDIAATCIPAHEVGGDFFDFLELDDRGQRLCVIVGDVAGKAMPAAMTAVMSDGMVISRIGQGGSVAEIMSDLNRSIYGKVTARVFTALCLAVLDRERGELTFANAGLCQPLLRSAAGTEYVESEGPKVPLGSFPNTAYESRTFPLAPDDVIVFFSDGLPEARDSAGKEYGYEALVELLGRIRTHDLSAERIREAIVADIRRFAASTHQSDDIVLVVVKREHRLAE